MSLQEEGLKIINDIAEDNPKYAFELLVGFLPLVDLGCEATVKAETTLTKNEKLDTADDICEDILVKMVKSASKVTQLKDMIQAAKMMRCGGS